MSRDEDPDCRGRAEDRRVPAAGAAEPGGYVVDLARDGWDGLHLANDGTHDLVILDVWQHDGQTGIGVENPGPPIPPSQRARLFERFYRADLARQRDPGKGGAGLGLAIVKAIVELHGGSVGAECRDGIVQFVVRLPLHSGG